MFRKVSAFVAASIMLTMSFGALVSAKTNETEALRLQTPLNIAVLVQDDLT